MVIAKGNEIYYTKYDRTIDIENLAATCEEPEKAAMILNKAMTLNNNRNYTASARLYASVEDLKGFKWNEVQS